jgi:hypothetical protein
MNIEVLVLSDEAEVNGVPFSPYRFFTNTQTFYETYGFQYCNPETHYVIRIQFALVGRKRIQSLDDQYWQMYLQQRPRMEVQDVFGEAVIRNDSIAQTYIETFEAIPLASAQEAQQYQRDLRELAIIIKSVGETDSSLELMCKILRRESSP